MIEYYQTQFESLMFYQLNQTRMRPVEKPGQYHQEIKRKVLQVLEYGSAIPLECRTKLQRLLSSIDCTQQLYVVLEAGYVDEYQLFHNEDPLQYYEKGYVQERQIQSVKDEASPCRSRPRPIRRRFIQSKGGRKPADPSMQLQLAKWLVVRLQLESTVDLKEISQQAKLLSTVVGFKSSKGWFCRFKNRLVNRRIVSLTPRQLQLIRDL